MGYPTLGPDCPPLKIVEDLDKPKFLLTPNKEWRKVDEQWARSTVQEAEDYVYNLVLHWGATSKLIAQRFGLDQKVVERTFGPVIAKAQAELAMTIFADQINIALTSSNTAIKQHVGRFFAGQIENQVLSTTDENDNKVEFEVKLVKVEPKTASEPTPKE